MTEPRSAEPSPPKGLFIGLRTKLILGFTLIFTLVFAAAYYWFYSFATTTAMHRITEDLIGTLRGATEAGLIDEFDQRRLINGDQLQALIAEGEVRADGYTDDPRYWEQVQVLCDIRRIEPRANPYTYIAGDKPNELIFITSWGACLKTPAGAPFKYHWETDNPGPNLAGLKAITLQDDSPDGCTYGQPDCVPTSYDDEFGSWISGFAPIYNSKGEVIAALGIDFEANYVKEVQHAILDKIYLAFGVTYLILFLLVFIVSQAISRPILVLTRAAEKIGEGDYSGGLQQLEHTGGPKTFPDEIATLSGVFESMVNKVYQRELTLRREVEELRIEIDEVKRQKAVGEIVESEFFRDLRAKAEEMRAQRRGRPAEA